MIVKRRRDDLVAVVCTGLLKRNALVGCGDARMR
jgi:hypothetical protein